MKNEDFNDKINNRDVEWLNTLRNFMNDLNAVATAKSEMGQIRKHIHGKIRTKFSSETDNNDFWLNKEEATDWLNGVNEDAPPVPQTPMKHNNQPSPPVDKSLPSMEMQLQQNAAQLSAGMASMTKMQTHVA